MIQKVTNSTTSSKKSSGTSGKLEKISVCLNLQGFCSNSLLESCKSFEEFSERLGDQKWVNSNREGISNLEGKSRKWHSGVFEENGGEIGEGEGIHGENLQNTYFSNTLFQDFSICN